MPAAPTKPAVLVLVAILAVLGILAYQRLASSVAPDVLAQVPDFHLVSDDGTGFDRGSVAGPWVANFLYTSCPGPCPRLVERLKKLRRTVPASRLAIVSFTVDPETDTPEVLAAYRRKHGIDPADNWHFVTGPPSDVLQLVQKGFLTGVGPGDGSGEEGNVAHGVRVALVDAGGGIRGFYSTESDEDLERLARDAATLR